MATDIARTAADDLTDAAYQLGVIEAELENARAHLARATVEPSPGNTAGLRRVTAVLAGVAAQAAAHASEAHRRAAQVSAVS